MEHWPWWLGAVALASVAVLYALIVGRPLGVSGLISSALSWGGRRSEKQLDELDAAALEAALAAATRAQFGDAAAPSSSAPAASTSDAAMPPPMADRIGWGGSVIFLVGIVGGGALAGITAGDLQPTFETVGTYARFFPGAGAFAALFFGGILVGAGTTLAGGCTSGHGLVGCARVQPASLIATASFFGTGIVVSFVLAFLAGGAP